MKQKCLVRRAPPLGHELKVVLAARGCKNVELGGQISPCVFFREHICWCHLGVPNNIEGGRGGGGDLDGDWKYKKEEGWGE